MFQKDQDKAEKEESFKLQNVFILEELENMGIMMDGSSDANRRISSSEEAIQNQDCAPSET
jgi:hypothetical protein